MIRTVRAGPRESAQECGLPGVPPSATPAGDSQRSPVHPTFSHRHGEALAGVPAAESGGAMPREGRVPRRHKERERAGDQRELGAADGLRPVQTHLVAGDDTT